MATSGYVFANLHNDGVHIGALPFREYAFPAISGSMVVQADWALLMDCLLCRWTPLDIPGGYSFDVYPHRYGTQLPLGATDLAAAVQEAKTALRIGYMSPDVMPSPGIGQWSHVPLAFVAPSLNGPGGNVRALRRLDTIRRVYYDIKRMRRRRLPFQHQYKDPTGFWGANYPHWRYDTPSEDFYDPDANRRYLNAIELMVPENVRAHREWSISPVCAVVEFEAHKGDRYEYSHIVVDVNADGSVPTSGWTSADCRAFATTRGITGEGAYAAARVADVYYDCNYPHSQELAAWDWAPS